MKSLKKQVKHQTSTCFLEDNLYLAEDNTTIRIKNTIWFGLSQSIYFEINVFQMFNKIKGDCCVS